jgi:hypothetical protein
VELSGSIAELSWLFTLISLKLRRKEGVNSRSRGGDVRRHLQQQDDRVEPARGGAVEAAAEIDIEACPHRVPKEAFPCRRAENAVAPVGETAPG